MPNLAVFVADEEKKGLLENISPPLCMLSEPQTAQNLGMCKMEKTSFFPCCQTVGLAKRMQQKNANAKKSNEHRLR